MKRLGFYFNMNQCLACKGCQIACKDKNKLEEGVFFRRAATISCQTENGMGWANISLGCSHCEEPACAAACPTGAMHRAEDGTVIHDRGKCIGCGSCVANCPYGVPFLSPTKGYARKCDSCFDLRAQGKQPACVAACPTRALQFGPLEELQQTYGEGLVSQIPILPDEDLTGPSLLIRPKVGMEAWTGHKAVNEVVSDVDFSKPGSFKMNSCTPTPHKEAKTFRLDTEETFAVLGGGIAGVRAALAIRERNQTARILLIEGESILPYSRTMLSKAAFRGFDMKRHLIYPAEWYEKERIEVWLNAQVTSIRADEKWILLKDGSQIHYDKCIYALGADSFVPPISGADLDCVHVVRRQSDMEQIRRGLLKAKDAVIIGGGVIGLEIAWELKKSGLSITVIELAGTLMERLLDRETALRLQESMEDAGVQVITGAQIDRITKAEGVWLKDGTRCPADMVILSTGIRANVCLAKEAGLLVNRAIVVNARMKTSREDIYACGDCAEYQGVNTGTWTQSFSQGYIAGANAAGDLLEYKPEPAPIIIHAAATSLFSIGDMGKKGDLPYTRYSGVIRTDENRYRVNASKASQVAVETYYLLDGKVVGAALMGNLEKMSLVQRAVKEHWPLEGVVHL